jgi:hypothetical protein
MNRRIGEWANGRSSLLLFVLVLVLMLVIDLPASPPPATPTPFDASKVDTSTISEEEIQRTIAHRNALQEQQKSSLTNQAGSLSSAAADNQAADRSLKEYQSKVDALAIAAAKDHDAVLAQKAAILRRDIIIGVLALAIGVYAFLKFYLRIPFL